MRMEQWAPVRGFEGRYEVSTLGRVRSLLAHSRAKLNGTEYYLYAKPHSNGYPRVRLTKPGHNQSHYVHRLVLEAFVGPSPVGAQCRHLDGNRGNPILVNLRWGSYKENKEDSMRHGTAVHGERCGTAKLTDAVVAEIRRAYVAREANQYELAARYKVSQGTIGFIVRGETWTHLLHQALPL